MHPGVALLLQAAAQQLLDPSSSELRILRNPLAMKHGVPMLQVESPQSLQHLQHLLRAVCSDHEQLVSNVLVFYQHFVLNSSLDAEDSLSVCHLSIRSFMQTPAKPRKQVTLV